MEWVSTSLVRTFDIVLVDDVDAIIKTMKITVGQLRNLIREVRFPGKKIDFEGTTLVLDKKSDPEWNLLTTADGTPVARQTKKTVGKKYRQGTNPDYDGYDSYALEQYVNGEWHTYSSDSHKGDLVDPTFLRRTLRRGY